MKYNYNFKVSNASEVDIPRVIAEAGDAPAILLAGAAEPVLLLLSPQFVAGFCEEDGVAVGSNLYPYWG